MKKILLAAMLFGSCAAVTPRPEGPALVLTLEQVGSRVYLVIIDKDGVTTRLAWWNGQDWVKVTPLTMAEIYQESNIRS